MLWVLCLSKGLADSLKTCHGPGKPAPTAGSLNITKHAAVLQNEGEHGLMPKQQTAHNSTADASLGVYGANFAPTLGLPSLLSGQTLDAPTPPPPPFAFHRIGRCASAKQSPEQGRQKEQHAHPLYKVISWVVHVLSALHKPHLLSHSVLQ